MVREVVKSREGGEYVEEVALGDRQRIQELYQDLGYLRAQCALPRLQLHKLEHRSR